MNVDFSLDGKVAIITGASRGMGAAMANLFVELGARVVIADVLDDEGQDLAASLGEDARYWNLDVSSEEEWVSVADKAAAWCGKVDVLINNAGVVHTNSLVDTELEMFTRTVNVNQVGVFLGMKTVAPHMMSAGGSIVNVSSSAGLVGIPSLVAYAGSKWAVRGMTRVAAMELGEYGIRVNAVLPGGIDTPMLRSTGLTDEEVHRGWAGGALQRIGLPREVAYMAAFLGSDWSRYCTGADFVVDGGRTTGLTSPLAADGRRTSS